MHIWNTGPLPKYLPKTETAGKSLYTISLGSGSAMIRIAALALCVGTALQQVPIVAQIRFAEVGGSGMRFVLENAPSPRKHMIETMAGGVAVFDADGDRKPDIFFTNGADPESLRKKSPRYRNRLFRNLGGLRFLDVTARSGVGGEGYSMGAAAADYDNDGDVDLFVAGVFQNFLYRNRGDGTFEDVTGDSGIASHEWAVAAGWFDHDSDGLLDLFVVNYADWTLDFDRYCGDRQRGLRVYCHPRYLTPIANRLYRNLGEGRFEDVSERTGLDQFQGRGMSVAFADFNGDGRQDAFVTNDNLPNSLFLNSTDGSLVEDALLSGAALLDHGRPVASMGVDVGDFDADGRADIVLTALSNETFPMFRGAGNGSFRDVTIPTGLAKASRPYAGWGVVAADLDNDGDEDIFTANSHVNDLVEHFEPYPYEQPNVVFVNEDGSFDEALEIGGAGAHRGIAVADFDSDGRLDAVSSALGEQSKLLRNVTERAGNWVALELVGAESNRNAIGSRVRLGNQTRWMKSSVGYASSTLRPIHFGLGGSTGTVSLTVDWPSGRRETVDGVPINRRTTIREDR